jgi:signal transduction histidine kinase
MSAFEGATSALRRGLLSTIDWFIPAELRVDTASFWQARIFALSHLCGPCLALVIFAYLYEADPHRGWPFWTMCVLCSAFWLLPFAMKLTRNLSWPAFISVCDLTFVSLFGSFFYGGVSSPFLPWFLTALLLGFFYLGGRPRLLLAIFAVNLSGFCIAYAVNGSFPHLVPVEALSGVGVISVCAATLYTSMMAIYYASVITAQSDLQREAARDLAITAQLRKAKEAAERANEAKSIFLAKMSHHLRTPLNAVIGYSEILIEEASLDGDQGQVSDLQTIHRAGRHLLSLVTDVLDVSKIDADDVEISVTAFDLGDFVEDLVTACRSIVTINGNEFVLERGRDLGVVHSDQTRLRQVVINLLSNAGKFTREGLVTLSADRVRGPAGDTIVIAVRDTGIGIAEQHLQKLFTDFAQAEASTSSKYGGTGLGLALSQKLCRLLDGEITVKSVLGEGSTFTISLPADGRAGTASPPAEPLVAAA